MLNVNKLQHGDQMCPQNVNFIELQVIYFQQNNCPDHSSLHGVHQDVKVLSRTFNNWRKIDKVFF